MRYSTAFAAVQGQEEDGQEEEVERTVSLTKYNSLNEKYTELKENRVKIVSILVVAMILVIIIFTALLLRSQGDEEDDEEENSRVSSRKKKQKTKRAAKQTETISKSSLAAGRNFEGNVGKRSKRVTKTFTQEPSEAPQRNQTARQDHISTPEEIRAQMSQGESSGYASSAMQREQMLKNQTNSSPDSMQMAAERMRQSVKYPRRTAVPKPEVQEPEHDPMDDWDMEEMADRKSQKAGKPSRKKRSRVEEDMEIMDLNDL